VSQQIIAFVVHHGISRESAGAVSSGDPDPPKWASADRGYASIGEGLQHVDYTMPLTAPRTKLFIVSSQAAAPIATSVLCSQTRDTTHHDEQQSDLNEEKKDDVKEPAITSASRLYTF